MAYDERRVRWVAPWTLSSFMMALRSKPMLTAGDYYHMKLPKTILSPSSVAHMNSKKQSIWNQ